MAIDYDADPGYPRCKVRCREDDVKVAVAGRWEPIYGEYNNSQSDNSNTEDISSRTLGGNTSDER